jgi:uncharacterized protein
MSQAAKAQDPSMEEILASIRQIISEDETKPAGANGSAAAAAHAGDRGSGGEPSAMSQDEIENMLGDFEPSSKGEGFDQGASGDEADVLELTPAMETRPAEPAQPFRKIDAREDVYFSEEPDQPERLSMRYDHRFADHEPMKQLLSEDATASVASAFGSLAHTVMAQNARTLDDLVREMLRPMLKAWLDDNLPNIVERLVRAEIERVSRGRG